MKFFLLAILLLQGCATTRKEVAIGRMALEMIEKAKKEKWTCAKACNAMKRFMAENVEDLE